MDRRVTPLRQVTSPTWGPPPPLHVNRPLTSVVAIRKNYYGTTICVPDQTNTKQLPLSVSIDKLV